MLAPYHPCLKQLYDMVTYYQLFREGILENNPLTLAPFFKRVSECWHIQIVLASSPFFRSLQHVAFADNKLQLMFLEGLVFSIFNEYNLSIRLGISKIVRNPDGDSFSIELFPKEMIQDYIRRFQPSIIGEHASIAWILQNLQKFIIHLENPGYIQAGFKLTSQFASSALT